MVKLTWGHNDGGQPTAARVPDSNCKYVIVDDEGYATMLGTDGCPGLDLAAAKTATVQQESQGLYDQGPFFQTTFMYYWLYCLPADLADRAARKHRLPRGVRVDDWVWHKDLIIDPPEPACEGAKKHEWVSNTTHELTDDDFAKVRDCRCCTWRHITHSPSVDPESGITHSVVRYLRYNRKGEDVEAD